LYNAALEERRDAYRKAKITLTGYTQSKELPAVKSCAPEYKEVNAQVLQEVLDRLDKAYANFFRRVREGNEKPGFPRFRKRDRYNTFTFPQKGFVLDELAGRLILSKLGGMKVKQWRQLGGKIKRCTIKRRAGKWYAVFCTEIPQPAALPKTGKAIGIDMGLGAIVTDSNGRTYGDLVALKAGEHRLRHKQRLVSRKKKDSKRRKHAVQNLARAHDHLARQRVHALHNISRTLMRENDEIHLEELNITSMLQKAPITFGARMGRGLRRNIHLAAWNALGQQLVYKAEEAGRLVRHKNPARTSQECPQCHRIVPKTLGDRWHNCVCGLSIPRDHAAAQVILQRPLRGPRGEVAQEGSSVKRKGLSRSNKKFRKSV
jgi:putative transposase